MLFRPWVLWAAVRRNRERIVHFHDPEIIPAALLLHWQGVTVVYDAHEDVPRQILSQRWLPNGSHRLGAGLFEAHEDFAPPPFESGVTHPPDTSARVAAADRPAIAEHGATVGQELGI